MKTCYSLISILILLSACSSQTTTVNDEQAPLVKPESAEKKAEVQVVEENAMVMNDVVSYVAPLPSAKPTLMAEQMRIDQPSNEQYDEVKQSSIKQVATDPVSTFSTDVDTASYTNARRFLNLGQQPPKDAVRVEEFINYFDYQLAKPEQMDEPLRIETELSSTPWNKKTELLRVSLQSYQTSVENMPPLNLVFLLDVSGSMNSDNKLPLMQRSFNLLVDQLRPQDHVAIVVYAGASGIALEPTSGDQKQKIITAINRLSAGGSTAGSAGIQLAYDLAQEHFAADHINRVILGTDGDFNVGTSSTEDLKKLIEQKRDSGVFLSVLGFGTGNYKDAMMETISNHGNGQAFYIDSFQEARKIFAQTLTATLLTVAKDVKVQIEFNPAQVAEYRLIGYDNRMLNQEDFNNDKVDAGDIGSGHSVTALYEIVRTGSEFRFIEPLRYQQNQGKTDPQAISTELAFVKVRYKMPQADKSNLFSVPVTPDQERSPSEAMTLASSVAGFAEILRASPYINNWNIKNAIEDLQPVLENDPWGYRHELLQLMKNADTMN
ncbi:MAG: VWA domain-containing protein [Reinekea sp.]